MSNYENADALQGLSLGKVTAYIDKYSPELLQGIPRSLNRDELNIFANNLPFFGEDIWYGYELSWLNNKGKPMVAVAEIRIPCDSSHIVESKSFKLYLNSFNQSSFSSMAAVQESILRDISEIVGAQVSVSLYKVDQCPALEIAAIEATCIDDLDIDVEHYNIEPSILDTLQDGDTSSVVEESLVCHLLKSNCLITNQPDWASLYITYRGAQLDHETLLAYIISFRQHNEFHEQCVERIYSDISEHCQLEELTVFARYTRRGGLDINPFRSNVKKAAPNGRTLRQ